MNVQEFKDTFDSVRASDRLRMEVMGMTDKKQINRFHNILPKLLLAAVLTALLATTVLAAPAILNALKDKEVHYEHGGWYSLISPDSGPLDRYGIYFDIEVSPDAPETIENYYLPELSGDFTLTSGGGVAVSASFSWQRGTEEHVAILQWPVLRFDSAEPIDYQYVLEGQTPEGEMVSLGSVRGYLFQDSDKTDRRFYWSDGSYLFLLIVPGEYTDAQIAQLVDSMHLVEDITPYLKEYEYPIDPDEYLEDLNNKLNPPLHIHIP